MLQPHLIALPVHTRNFRLFPLFIIEGEAKLLRRPTIINPQTWNGKLRHLKAGYNSITTDTIRSARLRRGANRPQDGENEINQRQLTNWRGTLLGVSNSEEPDSRNRCARMVNASSYSPFSFLRQRSWVMLWILTL